MPDSERTVELHKAIAEHMKTHGAREWARVRSAFPDVSPATFWRRVRMVRIRYDQDSGEACGQSKKCGADNANPMAGRLKDEADRKEGPPFRNLTEFYNELRQVARYKELVLDAENLSRQCMDRRGQITRPAIYLKSIALRQKLMSDEQAALEMFFNAEQMAKFYDSITWMLGNLSDAVLEVAIAGLRELGPGFTDKMIKGLEEQALADADQNAA